MLFVRRFPSLGNISLTGRRLLTWCGASLYLAGVTWGTYALFPLWLYDDPFITYRYAANLAQGNGFVYNLGEHTLSSTTILMVLLLAGLYHLSTNLPRWAIWIGTLSLALGGLALWDLARSWRTPQVGWLALLLYPTFPLLLITLSSEMPLVLALSLAAWAAYARRRYLPAAVLAALGVLARPDALLVAGLLAANYLWVKRGRLGQDFPWPAVLAFCSILLAWGIFAWGYFGSPLPVTLTAKQSQGAMVEAVRFLPGLLRQIALLSAHPFLWLEAALALVGVREAFRHHRQWLPFLSWGLVYSLAYTLMGVTPGAWYYAPLVPVFLAAAGLGLRAVHERLWPRLDARLAVLSDRYRSRRMHRHLPGRPWLVAGLVVLLAAGQAQLMWQLHQAPDPRFPVYRAVGKWLLNQTDPAARVAVLEVGVIGYFSQRTMIDFAGLLQPETARQLKGASFDTVAPDVVRRYRPDYIVVRDEQMTVFQYGTIVHFCQEARVFPAGFFGHAWSTTIYVCRYDS